MNDLNLLGVGGCFAKSRNCYTLKEIRDYLDVLMREVVYTSNVASDLNDDERKTLFDVEAFLRKACILVEDMDY